MKPNIRRPFTPTPPSALQILESVRSMGVEVRLCQEKRVQFLQLNGSSLAVEMAYDVLDPVIEDVIALIQEHEI